MNNTAVAQYRSIEDEALPGYVNMLVYGRVGVGKTVLGATGPAPILYLDLDDGLLSVRRPRPELVEELGIPTNQIYFERADSWQEFVRIVKRVHGLRRTPGFFKTVVLDNITVAQVLCMQGKLGELSVERLPERTDWNLVLQQMRAAILLLCNLPCNVLLIAHEQDKNSLIGPAIQGAAYKQIPAMVDLMARYEIREKEEDDGKGGKQIRQVRVLNFHATSAIPGVSMGIEAKNRGGWMNRLEKPHFGQLIEKLYPSKTEAIEKGSQ
jgi:hypothetical protein